MPNPRKRRQKLKGVARRVCKDEIQILNQNITVLMQKFLEAKGPTVKEEVSLAIREQEARVRVVEAVLDGSFLTYTEKRVRGEQIPQGWGTHLGFQWDKHNYSYDTLWVDGKYIF